MMTISVANTGVTIPDQGLDVLGVSFVIPCLNEEESLGHVIDEINAAFGTTQIRYEIVVADNGSTDRSRDIARNLGARVVDVVDRGYGAALIGGIASAKGRYAVMGDADGSYQFRDALQMIPLLEDGADVVMGNRFLGGIESGAMPWLHRHVGNPVLSALGRRLFGVPIGDFHCGLRAFSVESIRSLELTAPGMEFASEMVVAAQKAGLRILEVPVSLKRDLRSRPPHLRTWRDGWRHLRFLFAHSPRWTFLFPGVVAAVLAIFVGAVSFVGPLQAGDVEFSYRTSILACAFAIVAASAAWAFVIGQAIVEPTGHRRGYVTEGLAATSLMVALGGLAIIVAQLLAWASSGFSSQPLGQHLLLTIFGGLLLAVGGMSFFAALLLGLLRTFR